MKKVAVFGESGFLGIGHFIYQGSEDLQNSGEDIDVTVADI